jgi:hypothetical protein
MLMKYPPGLMFLEVYYRCCHAGVDRTGDYGFTIELSLSQSLGTHSHAVIRFLILSLELGRLGLLLMDKTRRKEMNATDLKIEPGLRFLAFFAPHSGDFSTSENGRKGIHWGMLDRRFLVAAK